MFPLQNYLLILFINTWERLKIDSNFFLDCRFKVGHSSSDCLSVYHSKYRYGHAFAYIHVCCDRRSTIQRKILLLYRFFKGI